MKEKELRELSTCAHCGKKIGQTPTPIMWKVTFERHMLNIPALQRQHGLAMMLGGNGLLASVMGPDEDMTAELESGTVMICDSCACGPIVLAQIAENEEGQEGIQD